LSDVLIASLQKRIDELTGENATIRAEAKNRRLKGKTLQEEVDGLKAQVTTLTTERDNLKTVATAQPSELQAEVDSLRAKLRDRDHRDKFKELAKAQGVTDPKAQDDLWSLSGYKAETDQIDETKITAAITSSLAGRDWLKAAPAPDGANGSAAGAATQTAQAAAQATRPAGPGVTRGAGSSTTDLDKSLEAALPDAFRLA